MEQIYPWAAKGTLVGSAAIVWNLDRMATFLGEVAKRGGHVDFICLHWYGSLRRFRVHHSSPQALQQAYLGHRTWHHHWPSPARAKSFVENAFMWMATQSHIWRAAWFGAWPNAPDGFASQMNALSSSGLTDMAYWYGYSTTYNKRSSPSRHRFIRAGEMNSTQHDEPAHCDDICERRNAQVAAWTQPPFSLIEFHIEVKFRQRDDPFYDGVESGSSDGAVPAGFDHGCSDHEDSEYSNSDCSDPSCTDFDFPDYDDSDSEQDTFERATDAAQDTKDQITAYAVAQLATQFRIHIFSILVFPKYASLVRWDRSGAVVTNAFKNFDYLVDFIWRYNNSSLNARGVDETVSTPPPDLYERALEILDVKMPVRLFQFDFATRGDGTTLIFVGYKFNIRANASPTGRATQAFVVWDMLTGSVVFSKDTWRVDLSRVEKEGDVYKALREKGVSHIPDLICDEDVLDHRARTQDFWDEEAEPHRKFRPHRHYRLGLGVVTQPLTSFQSSWELVNAIKDALQGMLMKSLINDCRIFF